MADEAIGIGCGIGLTLTLLVSVLAAPAHAQDVQPGTIYVTPLSHNIVDAQKFPHPAQTLNQQQLHREGIAEATKALVQQASGVNFVSSEANPYQPTILYHGFEISPIQGTPAGLSVYVDGARFNSPFGDLALWSVLPDEAINSLSIEDGNPIFGLNALGGAVNVQMKNGFTAPGGEAELYGGSFGTIEGNLEYGKQSGNVAAYADIGETHEGGWRNEQSSDIQNFYGDFGWRGQNSELHFNLTLGDSQLNGPGTVPVELLQADPEAQFTGPNRIGDKYLKFVSNFQKQFTPQTSLQAVLYYTYLREELSNGNGPNDLPCGPGPDAAYLCQGGPGGALSTTVGGAPIPNFAPDAGAYGYYAYSQLNLNTTNTNGYGGSVQITNTAPVLGFANHLVGGISYDGGFTNYAAEGYLGGIDAARDYTTTPGIPDPGYLLDEPGTVPVDVVIRNAYYGVYATDTLNLTDKFSITAGGRFNIANIALNDQLPPDPNAPGGGLTGRHYFQHFNPALGAAYDATPFLVFYGGFSEENAAPTPAELSCASPEDSCSLANFMSGDPALKQIVTHSWELGLRGTAAALGDILLSYDADAYYTTTNDDIEFLQSPYNPIGEGYFSNIGNVRRMGADFGLRAEAPRWSAYASYSRIDATYQSSFIEQSNNPDADMNGNITVLPGDYLPGIPKNIFKFGGSYAITPRLKAGLDGFAQTSTFLFGDEANLTKPLSGYSVFDLTASYQLTHALEVFGDIDNITGTKYYDYGTFSPTGQDGGVYIAQAPNYSNPRSYSIAAPRAFYAGVKLKF